MKKILGLLNLMTTFVTKHAKRTVSFHFKNNETCETACFASKRKFAKQQVCFAKHETYFVSCFAKYETKLVSLETLTLTKTLILKAYLYLRNKEYIPVPVSLHSTFHVGSGMKKMFRSGIRHKKIVGSGSGIKHSGSATL
jgi:hypothetical protein